VYQKDLTEFGQTTQVYPPLWLLSNLAENDLFNVLSIADLPPSEYTWALG
jgi:hypothetical protein